MPILQDSVTAVPHNQWPRTLTLISFSADQLCTTIVKSSSETGGTLWSTCCWENRISMSQTPPASQWVPRAEWAPPGQGAGGAAWLKSAQEISRLHFREVLLDVTTSALSLCSFLAATCWLHSLAQVQGVKQRKVISKLGKCVFQSDGYLKKNKWIIRSFFSRVMIGILHLYLDLGVFSYEKSTLQVQVFRLILRLLLFFNAFLDCAVSFLYGNISVVQLFFPLN